MGTTQPATTRNRRVSVVPHPSARFVSLAAAAVMLGIGETTVWHMTKAGQLPTVLLGRRRLIPRAVLEEFEAELLASCSDTPSRKRG